MPNITVILNGFEDKIHKIEIEEDALVRTLREKVAGVVGLDEGTVRINTMTKELRAQNPSGKDLRLSDYNIEDNSNIYVILRLPGGSEEQKTLDPAVRRTDKPDLFQIDDECAEMPCGHAVGPMGLTAWARSLIDEGKYEFTCPYKADAKTNTPFCGHLWEYSVVRQIAALTKDERTYFEMKISDNYLRKALGIQECPGCMSFCERRSKNDHCVRCPNCTKKKGSRYEFCWYCLKTWNSASMKSCGNAGCTGKDPRLRILASCEEKEVVDVKCPSVRACPKCGLLIEHIEACKQMSCTCGQKFCFICLKMAKQGSYQCGSWNFKCEAAPVQTEIVGA